MSVYIYRISQWIEKRFNAKGGNVITDFDPTAQAQLNFPVGVEDRYLQGWNRFAVGTTTNALAANFGRARIRNPVGSNVIFVIEQLAVSETTTDEPIVTWGATSTDLTTLVTLTFTRMDPRGNPQPTAIVSTNPQAAGGQALLQRVALGQTTVDFIGNPNQEIPVLPGQAVDVQAGSANIQLNVSWMWRERALELSELT